MRLLYFAWVREAVGTAEEEVTVPDGVETVSDLIDWLASRSEAHANAFSNRIRLRAAIDQDFVGLGASITGAHEIAIFPPVTGG